MKEEKCARGQDSMKKARGRKENWRNYGRTREEREGLS